VLHIPELKSHESVIACSDVEQGFDIVQNCFPTAMINVTNIRSEASEDNQMMIAYHNIFAKSKSNGYWFGRILV
jgi:hypothetical protein